MLSKKEIELKIQELSNDPEYLKEVEEHVAQVIKTGIELDKCYKITPEIWHREIANI